MSDAEQADEARGRLCELLGLDAESSRAIVCLPSGRGVAVSVGAAEAVLAAVEHLAEGACQVEPTPAGEWLAGVGLARA